jgi:ketosteroid isomerase-like protein
VTGPNDAAMQKVLDKQAIHEAILRYCRGVDRGDAELICSTYHPDAVDEHGSNRFTGLTVGPGIVDLMRSARLSMHHVTNQLIELHGPDRASCETYFTVWQTMARDGEDHVLHSLGRYLDRFERRDGEWKIAQRLVVVEHTQLLPPGGEVPPSRPGLGCRDRRDPSYEVLNGVTI